MTLRLMVAASPQALLTLSAPAAEAQSKTAARSSILVVPLTFPEMSTIANAMGRATAGAQWLVQPSINDTLGPSRGKVLIAVQNALANNEPEAAETAFFDWEKGEGQLGDDDTSSGEVRITFWT